MTTTIKIDLFSKDSIRQAKKELKKYQKSIEKKCEKVVSKLLDIGIKTAKLNCGDYGDVISFSKEITRADNNVKGTLLAVGTPVLRLRGGEMIGMNPLLMAEFGSGFEARVLDKVPGLDVGTGTFPGQTHAFSPNGWYYTDMNGETHHSEGESPTHPMHSAMLAMILDVNNVLQEVFGNG